MLKITWFDTTCPPAHMVWIGTEERLFPFLRSVLLTDRENLCPGIEDLRVNGKRTNLDKLEAGIF